MSFLELANYYYIQNVDTAIVFCEKAKDYSEKANYIDGRAESYAWLGYLANCKGNIIKSLEYNHKSLELQEETNNVAGMATSYNNIGAIYDSKGDMFLSVFLISGGYLSRVDTIGHFDILFDMSLLLFGTI